MQLRLLALLCAVSSALPLAGCRGGGNQNARLPEVNERDRTASSSSGSTAAERPRSSAESPDNGAALYGEEEKKSFIGRILNGGPAAPGYNWDGQYSVVTTTAAPDIVYNRAAAALRSLDFTVNSQKSQYRGNSAQIVAQRQDGTRAEVLLAAKPEGKTEIKTKIGAVGDRSGSERILDEIQKPRASAR
jgi:hypothetical protein